MIGPHEVRPGDLVRFTDNSVVVVFADVGGDPVLAEGTVNGNVWKRGDETFVPVFAERAGGREATTIWVDWRNVVDIEPGATR